MLQVLVGREYSDVVTDLVLTAKNSIKVLVYDWRWYSNDPGSKIQKFNQAIISQANAGVKVFALVNNDFLRGHIVDSKVLIKRVDTAKIMHAKMLIFDEKILVAGSHNLTKNAFELNHEISIVTDDVDGVARAVRFFNALQ